MTHRYIPSWAQLPGHLQRRMRIYRKMEAQRVAKMQRALKRNSTQQEAK